MTSTAKRTQHRGSGWSDEAPNQRQEPKGNTAKPTRTPAPLPLCCPTSPQSPAAALKRVHDAPNLRCPSGGRQGPPAPGELSSRHCGARPRLSLPPRTARRLPAQRTREARLGGACVPVPPAAWCTPLAGPPAPCRPVRGRGRAGRSAVAGRPDCAPQTLDTRPRRRGALTPAGATGCASQQSAGGRSWSAGPGDLYSCAASHMAAVPFLLPHLRRSHRRLTLTHASLPRLSLLPAPSA